MSFRPEGGRTLLEYLVLLKLYPVPLEQLQELRFEILSRVMVLLPRDIRLYIGHG